MSRSAPKPGIIRDASSKLRIWRPTVGKNTTTKPTEATTNKDQPEVTIGLDVSDKSCCMCVLDRNGEVAATGTIKLNETALAMQFEHLPHARVAFEVGTHSRWLAAMFEGWGHEVIVANARKLAVISQNDRKSDGADAELLARLARTDVKLLCPVEHRSEAAAKGLALVRSRAVIVRSRTMMINSIRGQVKTIGERMPSCDAEHFHEMTDKLPAALQTALSPLMTLVGELTKQIMMFDGMLEKDADIIAPGARRLTTINGVGLLTAVCFTLVMDDPTRFAKSRQVGPYLGLVPKRSQSGEIDKAMRISKAGDPYTRQLLVQCAQTVMRSSAKETELRQWGTKLAGTGKTSKRRATVAVARKLAVLMHHLLVTGETYNPFYERDRKAAAAQRKEQATAQPTTALAERNGAAPPRTKETAAQRQAA